MNKSQTQKDWATRAAKVLPAGGFGNFDPSVIIREGSGAHVIDEDGNEYIDYLIGSGPMLVGHAHPEVNAAVAESFAKGTTFFANNASAIELAEHICDAVPCAEQLRYVSTGGEADMYAIRLARAHTERDKILKFEGGYHGMSAESLMSLAPAQRVDFPRAVPDSAGIPQSVRDLMLIAPFNDIDATRAIIAEHGDDIAAVIVEPMQRLIPPADGFLPMLREETKARDIVLIFDEVVTGFRLNYGGAQVAYGVTPDLTTLGKVIGGGFPLAAIAGHRDLMAHFDKSRVGESGFTLQIGTLSGNPVAATAGLKTLEILARPGSYDTLYANGEAIMQSLRTHLTAAGVAHQIVGEAPLFDVVFTGNAVANYRDIQAGDTERLTSFNKALRERGILKGDSKFYISLALTDDDLRATDAAIAESARIL